MRVQRVDICRLVEGNGAESIEADFAVLVISPAFDHLDRAIKERTNPLGLCDVVFFAGRQDRPCGTSPYAVHVSQTGHGVALGSNSRRWIWRPLRPRYHGPYHELHGGEG